MLDVYKRQVLTPERWKYLCRYETTETENGGYKLTYYNEDVPVLTLEAIPDFPVGFVHL